MWKDVAFRDTSHIEALQHFLTAEGKLPNNFIIGWQTGAFPCVSVEAAEKAPSKQVKNRMKDKRQKSQRFVSEWSHTWPSALRSALKIFYSSSFSPGKHEKKRKGPASLGHIRAEQRRYLYKQTWWQPWNKRGGTSGGRRWETCPEDNGVMRLHQQDKLLAEMQTLTPVIVWCISLKIRHFRPQTLSDNFLQTIETKDSTLCAENSWIRETEGDHLKYYSIRWHFKTQVVRLLCWHQYSHLWFSLLKVINNS